MHSNFTNKPMDLVYRDARGFLHSQPWQDLTTAGTLTDPENGEDMEMVGWWSEPEPSATDPEDEKRKEQLDRIFEEALARIPDMEFNLTFVEYRDSLDENLPLLNKALFERDGEEEYAPAEVYDTVDEWYSDARYEASHAAALELLTDIAAEDPDTADLNEEDFFYHELWDELRSSIEYLDSSNPLAELLSNTSRQLFRASLIEATEGALWQSFDEFNTMLEETGGSVEEYVQDMGEYEGGHWNSYELVFSADPNEFMQGTGKLDDVFEITGAQIWTGGGPINGDGWLVTARRPIRVKRSQLSLDSVGWGYSAEKVFGLYLDEATVTYIPPSE